MKKLIETLKAQTKSLKAEFVAKSIEFAKNDAVKATEQADWSYEKWVSEFPSSYGSKVLSKAGDARRRFAENLKYNRVTIQAIVEKAEKLANEHYQDSIAKLATRIMKKGLNSQKIEMTTSRIGINIETIVTDGEKTVTATTITAWGPVQRPHYRYLVK